MNCSIEGCGRKSRSGGMCNRHYEHNRLHGTPISDRGYTPEGQAALRTDGYLRIRDSGGRKLDHIVVAERALGKPLPPGAQVHHVDENKANNAPENLVICPSGAYHKLLHQRMRSMDACGHSDWRKCVHCKQYDAPENLRINARNQVKHVECVRLYNQKSYQAKQESKQQLPNWAIKEES